MSSLDPLLQVTVSEYLKAIEAFYQKEDSDRSSHNRWTLSDEGSRAAKGLAFWYTHQEEPAKQLLRRKTFLWRRKYGLDDEPSHQEMSWARYSEGWLAKYSHLSIMANTFNKEPCTSEGGKTSESQSNLNSYNRGDDLHEDSVASQPQPSYSASLDIVQPQEARQ